jgi:hypothetical protein
MADINKIDLTQVNDSLEGVYEAVDKFFLTDYTDSATIALASGRVENIGGVPYRVEDGSVTITDSGVANGDVYVHITEDGDGTASATISATAGTLNEAKGGYYSGSSKVVFAMTKSTGPIYSSKVRREEKLIEKLDIRKGLKNGNIRTKTDRFNIGPWDMRVTGTIITVSTGINPMVVAGIHVEVYRDDGALSSPLISAPNSSGIVSGGIVDNGPTGAVRLRSISGGQFDSTFYSSLLINRGYVYVTYEA